VWKALEQDLLHLKDRELDKLLYKVTGTEELYEARGLVKAIDLILALPEEFRILYEAQKETDKENT
jgi:hypothetical protein